MSRRTEVALAVLDVAIAIGLLVWAFGYVPFPRLCNPRGAPV